MTHSYHAYARVGIEITPPVDLAEDSDEIPSAGIETQEWSQDQ